MGALVVLGSHCSSGALAFFQQQQLYIKNHRLEGYGNCYLINVYTGNCVEVLMDYGLHPLRDAFSLWTTVPAEVWTGE